MKEKQNYFYCTADINNSQISHFQSKETPESQTVGISVSWELTTIYCTELKMSSLWHNTMTSCEASVKQGSGKTVTDLQFCTHSSTGRTFNAKPYGLEVDALRPPVYSTGGFVWEGSGSFWVIKFEALDTPDTNSSSMSFLSDSRNKI